MACWTGVLAAACIVIWQACNVLWRSASAPFWLFSASRESVAWQTALILIEDKSRLNGSLRLRLPSGSAHHEDNNTGLIACLMRPVSTNTYCLLHEHSPLIATKTTEAWDPRILLLLLACLHLHFMGVTKHRFLSVFLLILATLITAIGHAQVPTIICCAAAVVAGLCVYLRAHDSHWRAAAHHQMVAVPLAILGIAVAGDRMWTNLVAYAALFSAAVNCLWMQLNLSRCTIGLYRALTILLTLVPIRIATDSLGTYDTWRYTLAYAGCAALAPLVVLSLMPPNKAEEDEGVAFYFDDQRTLFFILPLTSKAQAFHHVLLQVCTSIALLGLSTSLAFHA